MCWWLACDTPKQVYVTPEFEANNRSSGIIPYNNTGYLPELLGYQTFKDSVWVSAKKVTNTPYSFIFRKYNISELTTETLMEFGDTSGRCTIRYGTWEMTRSPNPGAIDILLNKNASQNMHDEKYVALGGTMKYPGFSDSVYFGLSQRNGFLVIGKDSFSLTPLFKGRWKEMQTYIGVKLLKGETVYGVLYTLTGLLRHRAFVYTRATDIEQLLIAAYFAVIRWYV